jgi:MoaA/NifB/PqqE/SkfB family radical SAM enzyme
LDSYISEIAEQRSEMFNQSDPITPSVQEYEDAIRLFSQESRKHLSQAGNLGRRTGAFRLIYYDLVIRILREKRQVLPCYGGISNVHISPYGDVWPCCVLGYEKSMGLLKDADYDFYKIWRSERAKNVRRYIQSGNCWCPLANQAYSNMLMSPSTLVKVIAVMSRRLRISLR